MWLKVYLQKPTSSFPTNKPNLQPSMNQMFYLKFIFKDNFYSQSLQFLRVNATTLKQETTSSTDDSDKK